MAKDPTPQQWAASVLQRLGYKQTPGAIQALVGWAKAEGGHYNNSAKYNLLNTTQPEPGSQTFRSVGQGAADIRIYKSWDQGIDATVKTLENGLYGGILAGLKKGDPGATAHAIDASKWGTHGSYLYDAIGDTKVSGSAQPYASQPKVPHGASAPPVTTQTTPGVDNSLLRRQLVGQFLQQGGVANPQAVLSLAGAYGQAQDTPGTTTTSYGQQPTTTAPKAKLKTKTASGTATFEGKKVAGWIAPILQYAREQGWKGTVNSGFRSFADQQRIFASGVRPAAVPGTSNHEGSDFPRGAVDVSDASTLSQIIQNSPYAKQLVWAGSKDPVHFSHPHNGSY